MAGKGYNYWKALWEEKNTSFSYYKKNPDKLNTLIADNLLKKYGRSISTTYGADVGNYYFTNRFTALFIPIITKSHNDLSSLMNGLKSTMADKPIYEHSELHHILRLLHEKADVDISDFNIMRKPPTPLAYYVLALFIPIVGWGYLAFKLFEYIDSTENEEVNTQNLGKSSTM